MGGAGVQRWVKMTKYFHENDWQPIVYTSKTKDNLGEDYSLTKEVHESVIVLRNHIVEPHNIYAFVTRQKKGKSKYSGFIKEKKPGLAYKFSLFVRSNFFIPDARMLWIKPSIKYLRNWLKTNSVDAIISTGPPHSMHLIAMAIKKSHPDIHWVTDFRDPWTGIYYHKNLKMLPLAKKRHDSLEKQVLKNADSIVTVSKSFKAGLENISGRKDIQIIHNGYDHEDFINFTSVSTEKFIICHLGSVNDGINPQVLWNGINNAMQQNKELSNKLEIHFIGPVDINLRNVIEDHGLSDRTKYFDFMPHREAIDYLQKVDVLLLLLLNDTESVGGTIPIKFYEYIGTQKPILAIGPDKSDLRDMIPKDTQVLYSSYKKTNLIEHFILKIFEKNHKYAMLSFPEYSRKNLAGTYGQFLDSVIK